MTVVQLNSARNVRTLHNRNVTALSDDIFFPVEQVPLAQLTGLSDRGQTAIVRRDTNTVLAVHGKTYKLTTNESIYNGINQIIERCPTLDTNGLIIRDQTAYAGGRTVRSYIFPEHKINIGTGDVTNLRINVLNSYDGSCNLQVLVGGYRIVCANGMVVGEHLTKTSKRHTSVLDIPRVGIQIAAALNNFEKEGERWRIWAQTSITEKQAIDLIEQHVGFDKHGECKSESMRQDLINFWTDERGEIGRNLWALFNALTYWSTHADIKGASEPNRAAVIVERERKVAKTLNQPLFAVAA
ncbi:DUF932 domain-containing protein [Shewanella gaetbuli]|uniref:DUF945 domain-containing protein n=1 Tax=Shewanella gaetbuli TaxID=220752 RepID=A0A9X2CH01_9GAMM|nr:DUF932 domain-containing protein [Shewanella gaetbuli]MCL1142953.1 DUF945 domain-containing protein [Shewanella gaetbuli]